MSHIFLLLPIVNVEMPFVVSFYTIQNALQTTNCEQQKRTLRAALLNQQSEIRDASCNAKHKV